MEACGKTAIRVTDVKKIYKLYEKPSDRMREAFGLRRKQNYRVHYALGGVSMEIFRGETVGIIGTNGSGKSTILKIITGVLNPTAGEVAVAGRISALLELGAGFNMEYSGVENVYLNGTMMGFSEREIREKLDDILSFADIGAYMHQPVKTYSSGMFVRLAFAVAINIDPEILIVDEALSVGDVFFQAKCYHKFEEFKKLGKTIVFVSHDLSSISRYCDRVFLLHGGKLLGEGSPKEMVDAYKRVLVGQYSVPDNGGETFPEGERTPVSGKNPTLLEYGTKEAEILECHVTDEKGVACASILKGGEFSIRMKVRIHRNIPAPIFAFSIKNSMGTEITGTNTRIEKAWTQGAEAGQTKEVTFTQAMNLQGGQYLLSLGVTGYRGDVFEVYHRLYDVLSLTVVSDKDTVGFYDMASKVRVEDAEDSGDR
ncbi:MAG: ABC transporter ATP-binding protein [Clostridium sp.]|jgi:teichoic acid transport system ATP-binding protein|nr:ABC transporter ATP-binding protein [Clostridium sp.]